MFSRILWGARASLAAGLVSVAIAIAIGVPLGLLSGYVGGWVDAVLGRVTDAMLAIPFLILAIRARGLPRPEPHERHESPSASPRPRSFIRLTRGQVMAGARGGMGRGRARGRRTAIGAVAACGTYLPETIAADLVHTLATATVIRSSASLSLLRAWA